MPVAVGSNTCLLFCEGKPESLDIHVLQRLSPGTTFEVVPASGKQGLRSFIDGYLGGKRHSGRILAFRDRDFDAEPANTAALSRLPGSKDIYLSHRACIESYLLDPVLIRRYWEEKAAGPRWAHGLPPDVAQISRWIEDAARQIADYQAVRWALAKLKPGERWPEVGTTWTKGSGELPGELGFDACMNAARALVAEYRRVGDGVHETSVEESARRFRETFASPTFWDSQAYLVWFHGKDLRKAIQKGPQVRISLKSFCDWAVDKVDLDACPDILELERLMSPTSRGNQ